jgi:S-(hydroxymethyl)glutathione dehydrogenase/alcohol dehydrogenase
MVVIGAGGVGLNILQAAGMVSAYPVIAVDVVDTKIAMALKWGATHAFNSRTTPDYLDRIRELVGAQGSDVVVDTTGNARVIETAYELTHPDGKTILVGVPKKNDKVSIYTLPLHFKKVLKGSHGGSCCPDLEIPRLVRLIERGRMTLDGLVTHEFTLDKINDALALFRSGEAGRILINMSNAPA